MKKAILISVSSKKAQEILNHEMLIDVRRSAPSCELPIDVYMYCTEKKPYLRYGFWCPAPGMIEYGYTTDNGWFAPINGKVVAKYRLNSVDEIDLDAFFPEDAWKMRASKASLSILEDICQYQEKDPKVRKLYAWNISNLEILVPEKKLIDFELEKAHRSWRYVEVDE